MKMQLIPNIVIAVTAKKFRKLVFMIIISLFRIYSAISSVITDLLLLRMGLPYSGFQMMQTNFR